MRFNQPAYSTLYFSEKIWVKCPNCHDIGLVETELGQFNIPYPSGYRTRFKCLNCDFEKIDNEEWFGYYQGTIHRACGFCGSSISFISEPTKELYASCKLQCGVCNAEKDYEVKWYRYKEDKPIDPFFGFDLWLQIDIKSNTLWLYNIDHLKYLREYVAAKLRDDGKRHKYSMITNLPQWVKSAKNRDLIVRKLDKIEIELKKKIEPNIQP